MSYSTAQSSEYILDNDSPPEIYITGTSTLHDWKVTAPEVKGMPSSILINPDAQVPISPFTIEIAVNPMDGGRGNAMNEKIKTALKSKDFPHIIFSVQNSIQQTGALETSQITFNGELSMAGSKIPVSIITQWERTDQGVVIKGEFPMKLSDFKIDPPTAMFGQIKTRDDIIAHFEFRYKEI